MLASPRCDVLVLTRETKLEEQDRPKRRARRQLFLACSAFPTSCERRQTTRGAGTDSRFQELTPAALLAAPNQDGPTARPCRPAVSDRLHAFSSTPHPPCCVFPAGSGAGPLDTRNIETPSPALRWPNGVNHRAPCHRATAKPSSVAAEVRTRPELGWAQTGTTPLRQPDAQKSVS